MRHKLIGLIGIFAVALPAWGQTLQPVTTRAFDNSRSGANTSETITSSLAMSQGLGAGVWMAGQGLAADAQGFLYGISGNGSYHGVFDFGECVFKIQYHLRPQRQLHG
jgi:hypothetical protein